jgi:maltooligosyltrehalose trehalohydrolase
VTTRRVWAPRASRVDLVTQAGAVSMEAVGGGWWSVALPAPLEGSDYAFSIDGGEARPDPRSRFQPEGVHSFSRPVDFGSFSWSDARWRPPPLSASILYELHVGTFTKEGTFDAAIGKLAHLVDLGVTHVELMPVAEYSGERNWGYDGVDLFAPHHIYGGPLGLMRFVDACHAGGLGVIVDVVYNHLGPDGAYLDIFGPYTTDRYRTPWGPAINLDGTDSDEVRRFLCDNALAWLRDYHCDGLRIDAVHAMFDNSAFPFLEQLGSEVRWLAASTGKALVIIAESDLNQPALVTPVEAGGRGLDAQWNDDFHHAIHSLITGERAGYYIDFGSVEVLARSLMKVFVFDGRFSAFRRRSHGRPVGNLRADHFVGFIQNHDQIGNRARGERLGHLVDADLLKMAAAALFMGPFVPMLFQGEEWNASSPFLYFTGYSDPALAEAVRNGRREEFAHFADVKDIPDPQDPATFDRSKLNWEERDREPHLDILNWYKALIKLRMETSDFLDPKRDSLSVLYNDRHGWLLMRRRRSVVIFNFGPQRTMIPVENLEPRLRIALASQPGTRLAADFADVPSRTVAILIPED